MGVNPNCANMSFSQLICKYISIQKSVVSKVRSIASNMSTATPGQFLLLQFEMSQVTQVGDSISNVISQVQSMISTSIRNQKTS